MLRKITFIISLAAFSTSAFSYYSNLNIREFYLGIGAGPAYAKFQKNSSVSQTLNGQLNFNVSNQDQLAGTGTFETIFAGAATRFHLPFDCPNTQNGWLGLELNLNRNPLKYKMSNDEFVHSSFGSTIIRMKYAYGISLLPGYVFHDNTLFYGRLGLSRGDVKVVTTDETLGNLHQTLTGFRWGLGIRQTILPQVAVRLEYSHVNYKHTTSSTLDVANNVPKTTQITPQTNEVEIGVMYLFC